MSEPIEILTPNQRPLIGSKKNQEAPVSDATTKAVKKQQSLIQNIYDEQSKKMNEIISAYNTLQQAYQQLVERVSDNEIRTYSANVNAGLASLLAVSGKKDVSEVKPSAKLAREIQDNISAYIQDAGPKMEEFMIKEAEKMEKQLEEEVKEDK
jgi:uncharacterized protein YecA (UPF0149 family)